jgi:Uma2 family endonuclease
MSLAEPTVEIEYPESDGEPMGESDLHIHWMIRIRDILKHRYRDARDYVAADLLIYYAEGAPRKFVSPDVFVVKDCDPGFRRVFKVWEEGRAPDVVIEVTSKSTRREDEVIKPQKYITMGVKEYFLYDPTSDYLNPPLQGFHLQAQDFEPLDWNKHGRLECRELDISLELDDGELVFRDLRTGAVLLTQYEEADALRCAAETARDAVEAARAKAAAERDAETAARKKVEAERDALRAELERIKKRF